MRQRLLGTAMIVAQIALGTALLPNLANAADYLSQAREMMQKGDIRGAEIELRNALKADPHNGEARYRMAIIDLEGGDPIAAERNAELAQQAGYDSRVVLPLLAETYLQQRKFAELLRDFPANQADPLVKAKLLVARSLAQMALHDLAAAKTSLTTAEGLAPKLPTVPLAEARLALLNHDLSGAEDRLNQALKLDPHSIEAMLQKARILRARGDAAGAITLLNEAATQAPNSVVVRLDRADALLAAGQDAKAQADLAMVLQRYPSSIQANYLDAVLLARAKDFKAADAALQRISVALASIPKAYFLQAIVKANLGQMQQAESAADKYAARNPDDPAGARLAASLALHEHDTDKAIGLLESSARTGHADAQLYDLLGRAYLAQNKPDLAVENFRKAQELAPGSGAILSQLAGTELRLGKTDAAISDLEHSLESKPDQTFAAEALVLTELASGKVSEAEASLAKLRAAQGDTPMIDNLDGLVKLAQLNLPAARDAFAAALKRQPDFKPAQLNLAKVAALQGKPEEADKILSAVLSKDPANLQALTLLVNKDLQAGKTDEAIALVQQAQAAAPQNPMLMANLAELYIRAKQPKKAIDLLADASQQPNAPLVLVAARAEAEVAAGDTAAAQETYRDILGRAPAADLIRRNLIALLLQDKDFDTARTVATDGLKANPHDYAMLQFLVGIDLQQNGADAAVATAKRLQGQYATAGFPAANALLGDTLLTVKRYDDATNAYTDALKTAPSASLVLRLAGAENLAGKPDQSSQTLRDWLATHPDDVNVANMLASNDILAHRYDDGIVRLKQVLAQRPYDGPALNNLAWAYQQTGDKDARAVAQRAYLLNPAPETADTLGWILTQQGDAATGLPLLREAHMRMANDPEVQYHLAIALKDVGQRDEAIKLLTTLVSGPQTFDEKPAAKKALDQLMGKS